MGRLVGSRVRQPGGATGKRQALPQASSPARTAGPRLHRGPQLRHIAQARVRRGAALTAARASRRVTAVPRAYVARLSVLVANPPREFLTTDSRGGRVREDANPDICGTKRHQLQGSLVPASPCHTALDRRLRRHIGIVRLAPIAPGGNLPCLDLYRKGVLPAIVKGEAWGPSFAWFWVELGVEGVVPGED